MAESLTKGTRVIVSGRLKSRTYDTKEGEKRTVMELEVDEIGPSLRYSNAKINRTQRANNQGPGAAPANQGNQGGGYAGQSNQGGQSRPGQAASSFPPANDPWAVPSGQGDDGWGSGPTSDEPPF